MSQVKIYNKDGNVSSEMEAPNFLLAPWNVALVHQVFKAIAANKRINIAHTKNRAEVSGGGVKPWKQKGTGRARHGSIRSPIWRHGGVAFGPRNTTDYSQKVNKKMLKNSLISALAMKFSLGNLKVVSGLESEGVKTKNVARVINNLTQNKSTLLVVPNNDKTISRGAANVNKVKVIRAKDLNTFEAMNHLYVLIDQQALAEIK